MSRREELQKQSYRGLRRYLRQGLIDQAAYEKVAELLALWEKIDSCEERLEQVDKDREKIYRAQKQIQGNLGSLSKTGKEGALRSQYIEQLGSSEHQLKVLAKRETELKAEIEQIKAEIEARLERSV